MAVGVCKSRLKLFVRLVDLFKFLLCFLLQAFVVSKAVGMPHLNQIPVCQLYLVGSGVRSDAQNL